MLGLKFDDLLVENEDVAKAISRLAPAVRVERYFSKLLFLQL